MSSDHEKKPIEHSADPAERDVDESRRAAMIRLAKYTAPVMLALLLSEKTASAS
jgi:hypothetical protein